MILAIMGSVIMQRCFQQAEQYLHYTIFFSLISLEISGLQYDFIRESPSTIKISWKTFGTWAIKGAVSYRFS